MSVRSLVLVDTVRSVLRRFDAPMLARGAVVVLGLALLGGYGLVTPVWNAPLEVQLSRFVEAAVTGLCVFVAVAVADGVVDRGRPRLPVYAVAVGLSAVAGAWISWEVREAIGIGYPVRAAAIPHHALLHRLDVATIALLVGGLATTVHANRRAAIAARRRQQAAERARAAARRRTLESELQALQARVEPAFLFDTLRRIRAFHRIDAVGAGAMLEDLIVYLRAALPHMRESTSTVEREATLSRAWLEIVRRTRPGWSVDVRVAADAADRPLPALVLLPLVQHVVANAGDGALAIVADATLDGVDLRLRVSAADGSAPPTDAGPGAARAGQTDESDGDPVASPAAIAVVAERLRALYGAGASVVVRTPAGGREVLVRLPLERAGAVAA